LGAQGGREGGRKEETYLASVDDGKPLGGVVHAGDVDSGGLRGTGGGGWGGGRGGGRRGDVVFFPVFWFGTEAGVLVVVLGQRSSSPSCTCH
jgi:hypothetical protein